MAWTSPRTWVAGEKPSASTLNVHIRDNLKAIGDAWTSYTPSLTGLTLGNGTLNCGYSQAGKLVNFRAKVTFGSTTAVTGGVFIGLPANATATRTVAIAAGLYDSSASAHYGAWALNTAGVGSAQIRTDASAALSSTVPFTWATSDEIYVLGSYEAA